ncbi:MAG: YdcF family protein [Stellaceae bacterium]
MLFVLSRIVDVLSTPGNLVVLLLLIGAVLLMRGRRRGGEAVIAVLAVLSLAVTVLPVVGWISAPLEDRFPEPHLPAQIDGIILLGGAVRLAMTEAHGEVALNEAAERITETIALARRYPGVPIVVSGGNPSIMRRDLPKEATVTRKLLVEDGVEPGRILVEDRSRNTFENAVYSKQVAHPRPGQVWVLVTSANHMPRAVGCFRHVGWEVLPFPVEYHSGGHGSLGFNFAGELDGLSVPVHEWVGLAAYRLLGRIDSLLPGPH